MAEFTVISEWDKLINRVRLETSQRLGIHKNGDTRSNAVVVVGVVIYADCNGDPLHWEVESSNIEPASRARKLVDKLKSGLVY